MSYAIESIAQSIGARRVGEYEATIDWLLTDSRSLSFPEETLFFALTTKRNSGVRYIPELYARGVRNFVVSEEEFKQVENGELRIESAMQGDDAQPILNSSFSIFNSQLNKNYGKENPSIYRHVDAYRLPRHGHHRFQPQACRPDLP